MRYFVGLDWAAREHAVCVVDGRGAVVVRFTVAHSVSMISKKRGNLDRLPSLAGKSRTPERWCKQGVRLTEKGEGPEQGPPSPQVVHGDVVDKM